MLSFKRLKNVKRYERKLKRKCKPGVSILISKCLVCRTNHPTKKKHRCQSLQASQSTVVAVVLVAGYLSQICIRFSGTVKSQWKTVAGTARSPEDYAETTGAVEFAPGSRGSTINITIMDDNFPDLQKTFSVELFNPEGGGKLVKVAFNFLSNCLGVELYSAIADDRKITILFEEFRLFHTGCSFD